MDYRGDKYFENDIDDKVRGIVSMAEGTGNVIKPIQVDSDGNLNVNLQVGSVTTTPVPVQIVAILQSGTSNDVDANITNSSLAVTQSGTWVSTPTGVQLVSILQTGTSNTVNLSPSSTITAIGKDADGAVVTGNPVLVSGYDGSLVQTISTDTNGNVNIADGGNSITIDGSVSITTLSPTGTVISESIVSVAVSNTLLKTTNISRKRLTIQNHGSEFIRVSLSGTASATSPYRLVPQVGTMILEGNYLYTGTVKAFAETGTNNVGVIEET